MGDRSRDRTARVYVGGLTESIKKEDLEGEFEKYGKLNSVWVAFNPPGFAFIEFNSLTDAETACDNLNGTEFLGAKLRVEIARGRPRRGGPRGGGGGFRGSRGGRRGFDSYGGGRRDGGSRGDRFGGRSYDRRRDSFSRNGYGSSGGGGGGSRGGRGGGRFNSDRFRSRSPNSGPPRRRD
ncbi:RNA-binding protein Rsf1 [Diorhabda carinulata]|uniref:RNA-binding protein Rsf1 n=1 Tax=Diorhabda sublineata TaxID=1163346 RepID=UPI0024E10EFE|nr:RNA-binding protein Rsf1 [Diorhabda sublineata]XP_057656070.1 RNA-binding protein Rsf1 [Diorhabda carinulata]